MNRRKLGLLAGASLLATQVRTSKAYAAADASLLKSTLTPFGAERAGNADGSIPAWTGGNTTVPAGWQSGDFMPNPYASDQSTLTINSGNMGQYSDLLSEGTKALMTKYGFSLMVYPTHRSAAAPQWVYDNMAANVTAGKLNPGGGRLGFTGSYGGAAFPIPDTSDPLTAGAQIIWNHITRWNGSAVSYTTEGYGVNGGAPSLSARENLEFAFNYYKNPGSAETFDGWYFQLFVQSTAPQNIVGQQLISWQSTTPYTLKNQAWELLNGEGRVRRAPEIAFDNPDGQADGVCNYDEVFGGFCGSPEKYDWKFVGKKEMYVPYHTNDLHAATVEEALQPHFIKPELVRWEKHRVWVVEATLHPGERNVMARRTMYFDEDTWTVLLSDNYDANNNLYHVIQVFNMVRPDLPGTICITQEVVYNIQTGDYTTPTSSYNEKARPTFVFHDGFPAATFDSTNMAAQAQY